MRFLMWILTLLLLAVGGVLAVLSLGVFASLSAEAPLWLQSLGTLEAAVSGYLGRVNLDGFQRAVVLALLSSTVFGLAAFVKPRA